MDSEEEEDRKLYLELFGDHGKVFADLASPPSGNSEMLGDGPAEKSTNAVSGDAESEGAELASDNSSVPPSVPLADLQTLYRAHVSIIQDGTSGEPASLKPQASNLKPETTSFVPLSPIPNLGPKI